MYTKAGGQKENRRAGVLVFSHTGTCHEVSIDFNFTDLHALCQSGEGGGAPQISCPSSPISSFHPEGLVNGSHRKTRERSREGLCGNAHNNT